MIYPLKTDRGSANRLLGIEDGSFEAFSRRPGSYAVLCCAELMGKRIVGVRLTHIEVDGLDATEKLLKMMDDVAEAEAIILGGITFAGFNIVNPVTINQKTGIPIIVYSGKEPDNEMMFLALQRHFKDWNTRWNIIEGLGEVHKTISRAGEPPVYFEVLGESKEWGEEVLRSSALVCRIPEPVRVANLIAKGIEPAVC